MQYDQQFYSQRCSDNSARHVRLNFDGEALGLRVTSVDVHDQWNEFETELYLDEQDREALAAALGVATPSFSPVEHVALGFSAGFVLTFIAFVAAWGAV